MAELSPLERASQDHLADCRFRNLSRKTVAHYKQYEGSFIGFLRSQNTSLHLRSLNAANVKTCAEWIRGRHGGKRDGQVATNAFVGTMKIWAAWLCAEERLEIDPLAHLRRPKVTKIARRPLELHEVQAIRGAMAESMTGVRDIAVFRLLLATGIRIGELCGLELDDVDMKAFTLRVRGKGNHERVLRFGDGTRSGGKTVEALRDYLRTRRASRCRAFFLSHRSDPMTPAGFGAAYVKACKRAGVKDAEPHRTRHTFATHYLLRHRGDVEGLRYMMGHLSDDMYRVYTSQAGRLIAELNGDEVGADAMVDGEQPALPYEIGYRRRRDPEPTRAPVKNADESGLTVDRLLELLHNDPQLRRALLQALRGAA